MSTLIEQGGPNDRTSIRLATRQENWIRNVRRQEAQPETLRAGIELFRNERPKATLRSASACYNCMALPFGSRRTWVAPDDLEPVLRLILRDDAYRQIAEGDLSLGDLVVYHATTGDRGVSHVAIVVDTNADIEAGRLRIFVLSKWGQFGEYIHEATDVPWWLGAPAEYWTDRRVV